MRQVAIRFTIKVLGRSLRKPNPRMHGVLRSAQPDQEGKTQDLWFRAATWVVMGALDSNLSTIAHLSTTNPL